MEEEQVVSALLDTGCESFRESISLDMFSTVVWTDGWFTGHLNAHHTWFHMPYRKVQVNVTSQVKQARGKVK